MDNIEMVTDRNGPMIRILTRGIWCLVVLLVGCAGKRTVTRDEAPPTIDTASKIHHATETPKELSLELPYKIGRSAYIAFPIFSVGKSSSSYAGGFTGYSFSGPRGFTPADEYRWESNTFGSGNTVNVLYSRADGDDAHLLLDQKGIVVTADAPHEAWDTLQSYILYRLVLEDRDRDGRLTAADQSDLYISDLAGRQLRRITPDSLKLLHYFKSIREGKLIIQARVQSPRQTETRISDVTRLFWYDITADSLYNFHPNDDFMLKAYELFYSE